MQKLGQHFLKSKRIVAAIVNAAEITKKDIILEVGPGRGILTEALLEKAGKVIAIEKDKELVRYLSDKFSSPKNLVLIEGDILTWKPRFHLETGFPSSNYKIVANIPYYITSRFLRKFLTGNPPAGGQPKLMVLMVQKEVAKRIVAKPPEMSILSVSVQVYAEPKIVTLVSKRLFSPPPKVDSAVIKLQNISRNFFTKNNLDEKEFFALVKKGFSHKRKILKNNLSMSTYDVKKCKISPQMRAQELSLRDWKCLLN